MKAQVSTPRHSVILVGLGFIGYKADVGKRDVIFSHARAILAHEKFDLIAAIDSNPEVRRDFSTRFNIPTFASVREIPFSGSPAVVVVATPTKLHCSVIAEILKVIKPKFILCEKPLCENIEQAAQIIRACEENDVLLLVNFMRRADRAVAAVRQRILTGEIAQPIKGFVWYSKGLFHNGSHFFDLLKFWLGKIKDGRVIADGRLWGGIDPEPDLVVQFERGSVIFQSAWEEAFSHYTIELLSPEGRLRYDAGGEEVLWYPVINSAQFSEYRVLSAAPVRLANDFSRYMLYVYKELDRALAGQKCNLTTGQEAIETVLDMQRLIRG